jgi:transposase InsO family protein
MTIRPNTIRASAIHAVIRPLLSLALRLPAVEAFTSLLKPGVLVEDWRIEYNTVRPRNALGWLTPTDYAKAWATIRPERS